MLTEGLLRAQMVQQQFELLFPGKVLRIHMGHDTREIDTLVREYWSLRRKLMDLLDEYSAKRRRQQPIKPAMVSLFLRLGRRNILKLSLS